MECSVCCSAKCKATCPYCSYDVCRGCTQRYLLELTTSARCMNCAKIWNRETIETVCGVTFSNGPFQQRRSDLLFEREKALFPMTQPIVTRTIRRNKIQRLLSDITLYMVTNRIRRGHPEYEHRRQQAIWLNQELANHGLEQPVVKKKKPVEIRKCPCENCKGFLDKQWRCQICETPICKHCNEPVGAEHTCDPGAIETMKLLREDTKGCPSCGCMISKISGCSQMWCTECHTTFDWNTLAIEKGVVHNPHYFEYMRQNGGLPRQPGDQPGGCGGDLPNFYHMQANWPVGYINEALYQYRKVHEFSQYGLKRIPEPLRLGQTLQSIRVQFMMNELTEAKYRALLCKQDKYNEKMTELTQVRDMYVGVFGDLLREFADKGNLDVFQKSYKQLREFTQAAFKRIAHRFKCVEIKV